MADKKAIAEFAAENNSLGGRFGRARLMVEKPKSFKKTMKRLWGFFKSEKRMFNYTFVLVIISSLLGLIVPFLIGIVVDNIHSNMTSMEFHLIIWIIIIVAIVYVTNGFITFLQNYFVAGISQRIVYTLRRVLFGKLQKLPISYFDLRTHGEIMSRLSNDIDNISNSIANSTTHLMSLFITILGSLIIMLILSPLLTLGAMITIPLVFLLTSLVSKKTRVLFREQQKTLGKLNGQIEENISGILVVRVFNKEDKATEDFRQKNDRLSEVGLKANIISGFLCH